MNSKFLSKFDSIMRCFTPSEPRWTGTELAKRLGMPVTTLHGLLADFVEMDFLAFSHVSKEYSIGFRYMEMGVLHSNNFELNNIALGIMHELVSTVDHLVGLSVMYKGWMYVSTTVLPFRSTNGLKYVGPRLPAHMSAGGMAILAHLSRDVLPDYCNLEWDGRIMAPVNLEELELELGLVQESGYALSRTFAKNDLPETVGAPVFGKNGQVIAGLVVIGSSEGFPADNYAFLLERLTFSANEITMRCGHIIQAHSYV